MAKTDRISKWLGTDQQISDDIMEEIVATLDARDPKALREMFSEEALEEATELDQQIADIMDFYQGKMVSYKGDASSSTSTEYGEEVEKKLIGYYSLVTDKATYQVSYQHITIDSKSPQKIGLIDLELVTDEFFQKNRETVGPYNWQAGSKGPGVYTQK